MPEPVTREPQQARGHLRLQGILKACGRIIVSQGYAGLTMHGLAKEATTSIGSLYHFFPNKQAVIQALMANHANAMQATLAQSSAIPSAKWEAMTAEQVIHHLIMPMLTYISENPDYLAMMHCGFGSADLSLQQAELDAELGQMVERVLTLRLPAADPDHLRRHSLVILGIPIGILYKAQENPRLKASLLLADTPSVMAAYLRHIEHNQ